MKLCVGILFAFVLTGCFGEDYDVGVPTASVQVRIASMNHEYQLTEANITWSSSSGDVNKTVENIEEFGFKQDKIWIYPNQEATLDIKENEENGGDSWPDSITATLWNNGAHTDLEVNEYGEFTFPDTEGTYMLEVTTRNSANKAQYVGNVVIETPNTKPLEVKGKLPEFQGVEPPTIRKMNTTEEGDIVFDHSYSEVCWNNCNDKNTTYHVDIFSGDVEIGDRIQIDWHKMNPQPTEIHLLQLNKENEEVIKTVQVDSTNTPLEIVIEDEHRGSQYALEFFWREGKKLRGKTVLNFGFE